MTHKEVTGGAKEKQYGAKGQQGDKKKHTSGKHDRTHHGRSSEHRGGSGKGNWGKVGDELEVKILGLDPKNRTITLSAKSREIDDEQEAHREYQVQGETRAGATTLGDLIKAQMDADDDHDGSEEVSPTEQ